MKTSLTEMFHISVMCHRKPPAAVLKGQRMKLIMFYRVFLYVPMENHLFIKIAMIDYYILYIIIMSKFILEHLTVKISARFFICAVKLNVASQFC